MKHGFFLALLICLTSTLSAQYTYTIKADSVKVTNCDSAELIIENHTQGVPGFLYNTGNGRTQFRRGVVKINGGQYLIGADTLNLESNAWLQGGNSFGTTGVLGTLDTNHLDLYTNDSFRVRLSNTGELLVGTIYDNANNNKLYVNGNAVVNGNFTVGYSQNAVMGNGIVFDLSGVSPNQMSEMSSGGEIYYHSYGQGDQHLFCNTTGNAFKGNLVTMDPGPYILSDSQLSLKILNADRLEPGVVVSVYGNVGIGTVYPRAQLHTTGTVCFAGLTNDTTQTRVLVSDANGNLYYRSASSLAANGVFGSGLADGQMPAGNRTINSSLAVNGDIRAQRLKLSQTGWPDYVFAGGYQLPTLPEIAQYIKHNNHLPGMPSAAEVEKKGIDVGDNQAALLKKIEELTLYAIEQDKKLQMANGRMTDLEKSYAEQLQVQKQEMEALKKEMSVLEEKIANISSR